MDGEGFGALDGVGLDLDGVVVDGGFDGWDWRVVLLGAAVIVDAWGLAGEVKLLVKSVSFESEILLHGFVFLFGVFREGVVYVGAVNLVGLAF